MAPAMNRKRCQSINVGDQTVLILLGELATLPASAEAQKHGHISNCQPIGLSQRASCACGHSARGSTR